jgi:polyribonucleotide nucleotidyltransferase
MGFVRESVTVGSKEISIETGKWAKQASGSVIIRCGDSMVLVTATGSKEPRDLPFMPLTCEYQEKNYSAGKIPGSFFRREGRLSAEEILICRLMDRPIRPLFPEGWRIDTQVIATVVSFDRQNATDVLAMVGASAALHISDLQFDGPVAAIRVGRVRGELVAFPTFEEREESDLDLIVSASREAIVMVEGEMRELSEAEVIDALLFAHESAQPLLDLQDKIRAAAGKPKREHTAPESDEELYKVVKDKAWGRVKEAISIKDKHARYSALSEAGAAIKAELCGDENAPYAGREAEVSEAYSEVKSEYARTSTVETRTRIDGRQLDEIRGITSEVEVLPSAHGSALFTRGETQALVSATLGTKYDEQRMDTLLGSASKRFFLHYNFPPFSTGEVKPLRGTGRREIGHGFLAERSIQQVLPKFEDFPYTLRVVSEILESNGSSSMASVCGASLALMDAGVPITSSVAGIAMGLIKEGDKYAVLSDILGDEDHLGDMDFKVTGTRKGICALQMDIKVKGLTRELLAEALEQARKGRLHILDKMQEALEAPRDDLSPRAPRIVSVQVSPDKIRDIIGPGGKTIRAIQEQTGASVDVADDGTVSVASSDGKSLQQALDLIKGLTMEPEVGAFYTGVVKRVVDFGAFVEIMPGTDGLLHISEIAEERIRRVEDVLEEGDEVVVKCINIDRDGKIRLSRREALDADPEDVQNFTM